MHKPDGTRSGLVQVMAPAVVVLALSACGESSVPQNPHDKGAAIVCLACGAPRQIVDLPQLENLLLTRNGRLFVSGQSNLYEIQRNGQSYTSHALLPSGTGCSGLAEYHAFLYALCAGGSAPTDFSGLYAMPLQESAALPQPIYHLSGMTLPNGMVATIDGHLYITDGPVAVEPKIVRLTLNPSQPLQVLAQDTWLLTVSDYPNGLTIHGRSLYTTLYNPTTQVGTVARIDIQADGSPGPVVAVFKRGIMDDLSPTGDTLLVTDWQGGAVFQIDLKGDPLQETPPGTFAQPSSVHLVGPPLFDTPTVLVTERYTGNGLWSLSAH